MTLIEAQSNVERMTERGAPFEAVESFIEGSALGPTQKAALWLLAWTSQDRRTQRRVVREALAHAAS